MTKTLEEAIEQQKQFIDAAHVPNNWREYSLNDNYEFKPAHDHGTGYYPVHKETGEVCECKMQWVANEQILICPVCFLEGT